MANPKKALVIGVGAEKGLGASVSARFAREGFHVFVAGRTAQSLELVVKQIRSTGGTATAIVADATKESDVQSLYDQVCAADGTLDVAVYNVGNNTPGAVTEMEADYFEQAWRVCCFGGFLFGREAARRMLPKGGTMLFTGASASMRGRASPHSTRLKPRCAIWRRRWRRNWDRRGCTSLMSSSMAVLTAIGCARGARIL